jgi:phosphatidylserine/phosphatidylglycerophosphate/cardiolipin synthase-like enzyme
MDPSSIQEQLARSFLDHRLSRGERQELAEALGHLAPGSEADAIRRHAFDLVRDALPGRDEVLTMIDWLEGVLRQVPVVPPGRSHETPFAEAHFSPGEDCFRAIANRLESARETMDICLFTITDDRLSNQILDAHRRGVRVRIITDNDKAGDLGSDIPRLREAGIPAIEDRSPFHMHHKFALFDHSSLITGSYNWTRGAARDNQENLIVTNDPRLVGSFGSTFERLWKSLT